MVEDDSLQTQSALLVQLLAVGAVLSPQELLDVFHHRLLRFGVTFPVAKASSGEMSENPPGIVLAILEKGNKIILHKPTSYQSGIGAARSFSMCSGSAAGPVAAQSFGRSLGKWATA